MKIFINTNVKKQKYKAPFGTLVEDRRDRIIFNYPSGKTFVKHKSMSKTYGKAYDFRSDG